MNTNPNLRMDPLTESVDRLSIYIKSKEKTGIGLPTTSDEDSDSDDSIRPFKGFAKPLSRYKNSNKKIEENDNEEKSNRLLLLIDEHVEEALKNGFDDSIAKFKGKSHFVVNHKCVVPK